MEARIDQMIPLLKRRPACKRPPRLQVECGLLPMFGIIALLFPALTIQIKSGFLRTSVHFWHRRLLFCYQVSKSVRAESISIVALAVPVSISQFPQLLPSVGTADLLH